jgi:hypothetical protein
MLDYIKNKLRPSDLVLAIYLSSILRQLFWNINSQWTAWLLTALTSTLAILIHANLREPAKKNHNDSSLPTWAWLLVYCAPLVIIYFLRAPFPDNNFDVLNYHLEHMERGLRGLPFISGDFFPTGIQINPAPDMATGILKYALGYRLGTILNLGAIMWTASLALRALRESIPRLGVRYLAAAYVISTEMILYLLSTYLIDLLSLPLLLEAALLTVYYENKTRKNYTLVHIGVFLGIALAFKLINLAFIIPIVAVTLYQVYRYRKAVRLRLGILPAIAALVAPAAPFLIYMWSQTGNPTFPYYNKLFRSPLWDASNIEDPTHGPKTIIELILWPFWVYIYPERGSEFVGGDSVYTGRITLGLVFAIVCIVMPRISAPIRKLGIIAVCSTFLWSASTGNLRYGIFLEIIGGVVTVSVLATLLQNIPADSGKNRLRRTALLSAFTILLGMQVLTSYRQAATLDQNLFGDKVQPTIFQVWNKYVSQLPYLLRDRRAKSFLSETELQAIESVDVWINAYPTSAGLMSSLRPEIPMISVTPFLTDVKIYDPLITEAGRSKFNQAILLANGKRLYSITLERNLDGTLNNLHRAGLGAANITRLAMPFYSNEIRMDVVLIEVKTDVPH